MRLGLWLIYLSLATKENCMLVLLVHVVRQMDALLVQIVCHVIGESAREMFLQSKLPIDMLGKVWALVDSVGAGKISQNQFMVAMVIIARLRTGNLSSVPLSIPQSLWNSIVNSGPLAKTPPLAPANALPQVEDVPWIIPDSDQKQFAAFFEKLDKNKTGFVTGIHIQIITLGEQAYSFFLKSKLSEDNLAIVWY